MADKNEFTGKKICAIFLNFERESFTYSQIVERTGFPKGTVKSRLHRLWKKKIIKRYKNYYGDVYHYKLHKRRKGEEFMEKKTSRSETTDTPTLPKREYLAGVVPQTPHHMIHQVKLTESEWERTEHLFSKQKDNRDRGKQRILENKYFKMVISPNTLNGALYVLEDGWIGALKKVYPALAYQLETKDELEHKGVSFDADVWANFRVQSEDMKLVFATSHYWRELDVEGREIAVNSFLQHIMRDSFEKTTYEGMMSKVLEQLLIGQEKEREKTDKMIEVMVNMDSQLKKQNEILEGLVKQIFGEPEGKEKKEVETVDLPDNSVMYG